MSDLLDQLQHRRMRRRWTRIADSAQGMGPAELREMRQRARELRRDIDRAIATADDRLTLPAIGSNAISKPLGCDWAWRPPLWHTRMSPAGVAAPASGTVVGEGTTLFHDCTTSELALRQIRNTHAEDLAPLALRMEVFGFDGSFLSLATDLPGTALDGLTRRHIISLRAVVQAEQKMEVFARLNIRHGPNTEQMVSQFTPDGSESVVEFDLAYSRINEKRLENAWVDLIFEGVQMNQIVLRDVALTRRPRAEV